MLACPEPCYTAAIYTEGGEEIALDLVSARGNMVVDEVSRARVIADPSCMELPNFCPGLSIVKINRNDSLAWEGPIVDAWVNADNQLELDARDGLWWLSRRVCAAQTTYASSTVDEFLNLVEKINNPEGIGPKHHYDFRRVVATTDAGPDGTQEIEKLVYADSLMQDLADTTIDYTVVAGELLVGYGGVPIPADRFCELALGDCDWEGLPPWGVSASNFYNDLFYFSRTELEGESEDVFTRATADDQACGIYQELETTNISHVSLVETTDIMLASQSLYSVGRAQSGDLAKTAPVNFRCLVPGMPLTISGVQHNLVEVEFSYDSGGEDVSVSVA